MTKFDVKAARELERRLDDISAGTCEYAACIRNACLRITELEAVAHAAQKFCDSYSVIYESQGYLASTPWNVTSFGKSDLTGGLREALKAAGEKE